MQAERPADSPLPPGVPLSSGVLTRCPIRWGGATGSRRLVRRYGFPITGNAWTAAPNPATVLRVYVWSVTSEQSSVLPMPGWLVADHTPELHVPLPVTRDPDGQPTFQRRELGSSAQRPLKLKELSVKPGQLFGAEVAADRSPETAGSDLNCGSHPVALPVIACPRVRPTEQCDGQQVTAMTPDRHFAHSGTSANDRQCLPAQGHPALTLLCGSHHENRYSSQRPATSSSTTGSSEVWLSRRVWPAKRPERVPPPSHAITSSTTRGSVCAGGSRQTFGAGSTSQAAATVCCARPIGGNGVLVAARFWSNWPLPGGRGSVLVELAAPWRSRLGRQWPRATWLATLWSLHCTSVYRRLPPGQGACLVHPQGGERADY